MPKLALENGRQNAEVSFFSTSDGHNVTGAYEKASLIAYLCTQCGLLLQIVHNFSVYEPIWS